MEILFVRHGEPCYSSVIDLNLVSYLGELTPGGIMQAETVSKDARLKEAEVIISSPFTRALQTAAIISKNTGLPIIIEPAFHEWLNDISHMQTLNPNYAENAYHEFVEHNGKRDKNCCYNWEEATSIAERAYPAMRKYLNYRKIIVVAHAMLIRTFGYSEQSMPNCSIYLREFDNTSKYPGFIPWRGSYNNTIF